MNDIDSRILEVIPDYVKFKIKNDNQYGSVNKGAGLLTSWKRNLEDFSSYDYIIHFEPRLEFNNYSLLDNFMKTPKTIITIGDNGKHFNTGLFIFKIDTFIKYLNSITPEYITNNKTSLEYHLFDFVIFDHNSVIEEI